MSYAGNRTIIDIDSHLMELDDFLPNAASPEELALLTPMVGGQKGLPVTQENLDHARVLHEKRQSNPDTMLKFEESIMDNLKGPWSRLGGFDPKERSQALDLFGYKEQWVLPTFSLHQVIASTTPEALEASARVLNRAMAKFCSEDKRLKAIGYIPMSLGCEKVLSMMDEGFAAGCYTFAIDSNEPDPNANSFTHPAFDPVWDLFEKNKAPVILHTAINGKYDPVSPSYHNNDVQKIQLGGDAPTSVLGFVSIGNGAKIMLSAMILDDVFDRHPKLKVISMEHGASWVPGWIKEIDFSANVFKMFRPRKEKPSVVAARHIRVSPFPGEQIGWIIKNSPEGMILFASDYPHIEGSGDPIKKFEQTMEDCDEKTMKGFYHDNIANFLAS